MTYFTAEELCMIEMLTYFNEARNAIYGAVSLSVTDNNTIERMSKELLYFLQMESRILMRL